MPTPARKPSADRTRLGRWGEDVAAQHLVGRGYTIVARNWRCSLGEIDIVAQNAERLALVEVKTRRGDAAGSPEEAISPHKAARLLALAQHYLAAHDLSDETAVGVDLVAIELDAAGRLLRCEHLEDAVTAW